MVVIYLDKIKLSLIFGTGDYGDKFYIILQGQVSVLLPKRKSTEER